MKESKFIDQNYKKWHDFEEDIKSGEQDPHKTTKRFVQMTDDLSYAQTFYKHRTVRVYLNAIAQIIFNNIYKNRKISGKNIKDFWKLELPLLLFEAKKELRLSFFILIFSVAVGVLSSIYEPEFARHILGDQYVDMTLENIEKSDPMAVYKKGHATGSFIAITLNNLRVDMLMFFMGIFAGIGTIYIMLSNGVMLGTFQYFFIERDLFWDSFLTIWQHGTLEISAMVIAGAAGLTMAKGLVFPGTYSRMLSFRIGAQRGLRILMGIFPVTIMAGIIEGYETRYTDLPDILRIIVIIASLGFIIYYYVLYPIKVAKSGAADILKRSYLLPKAEDKIDFNAIKSVINIFGASFSLLRKKSLSTIQFSVIAICLFSITIILFKDWVLPYKEFEYEMKTISFYFSFSNNLPLYLLQSVLFATIMTKFHNTVVNIFAESKAEKTRTFKQQFSKFWQMWALSLVYLSVLLWDSGWSLFFAILFLPFFSFVGFRSIISGTNPIQAASYLFKHFSQIWWRIMGLYLLNLFLGLFLLFFMNMPDMIFSMLLSILEADAEMVFIVRSISRIAIIMSLFVCFFAIVHFSNSMLYFTINELVTAKGLKQKIENIGNRKIFKFEHR